MWLPAEDPPWQLHRLDDPRDEEAEPELGFFCEACADRECGHGRRSKQ
ncbi:MAG TPA: hypothetical protein VLB86_00825 [Gaiellaceae bacterium]|nr:hypothetical protein [Gaiellaceae bacterium]